MGNETRLFRTADIESAWTSIVKPWITASETAPLSGSRIVLTPSLPFSRSLKKRLLADGVGSFGVEFITHTQMWDKLHSTYCPEMQVADRDLLHLFLSAAAEEHQGDTTSASVARDPSVLMRAMDQIYTAGWAFKDMALPNLLPVHDIFVTSLKAAGVFTSQQIEKEIAKRAAACTTPVADELLIVGFDSAHWPLWNILTIAAAAATSTTVCLFGSRPTADEIDNLWLDSWEDHFSEADVIPSSLDPLYSSLVDAMAQGTGGPAENVPDLIVGPDLESHARAIACRALKALHDDPESADIGIAFPGDSPLARETSRALTELGVPHNDTIAHPSPISGEESAWRAWIQCEHSRSAADFFRFLKAADSCEALLGKPLEEVTRALTRSRDEVMLDHTELLLDFAGLAGITKLTLPLKASLSNFVEITAALIDKVELFAPTHLKHTLTSAASAVEKSWNQPFSRDIFLTWLENVTSFQNRAQDPMSSHPYSRIHLVAYHRSEWRQWDHVILTSLNTEAWPPTHNPSPYLDQDGVDRLNEAATEQSRHGKGSRCVKKGHSFILGPTERTTLARAQFFNVLLASKTATLTIARSYFDRPSRMWPPGDFIAMLHAAAYGRGLTDNDAELLCKATAEFVGKTFNAQKTDIAAIGSPDQTLNAYRQRNDPAIPFNEYMFALTRPPSEVTPMSCTNATSLINTPELLWMDTFLGVASDDWDAGDIPWKKIGGIWIHRWIRAAFSTKDTTGSLQPLPDAVKLKELVSRAATQTAARAKRSFEAVLGEVPQWWTAFHRQSLAIAISIVDEITPLLSRKDVNSIATEWPLPKGSLVKLDDGSRLLLKGRIDMLLSSAQPGKSPFAPASDCLVIDHKTGARIKFTPGTLSKGEGMQILLYSLALKEAGASEASFTVAGPGGDASNIVSPSKFDGDETVFGVIRTMAYQQQTGIYGMAGDPSDEYGATPCYPLAVLAVPTSVLNAKHELSFQETPETTDTE